MCGIGLIVAGVPIGGHLALDRVEASGFSVPGLEQAAETVRPNYEDLCNVLARRGPDRIGGQILHLSPERQNLEEVEFRKNPNAAKRASENCVHRAFSTDNLIAVASTEAEIAVDLGLCGLADANCSATLQFVGATLQLRGEHSVQQPLVDSFGNVLVYNGEVFDGLTVRQSENDTQVIMEALRECCSCACHGQQVPECECVESSHPHQTVTQVLSQLRGPWALIYWQCHERYGLDGMQ